MQERHADHTGELHVSTMTGEYIYEAEEPRLHHDFVF